jgi:hypothetical protein
LQSESIHEKAESDSESLQASESESKDNRRDCRDDTTSNIGRGSLKVLAEGKSRQRDGRTAGLGGMHLESAL